MDWATFRTQVRRSILEDPDKVTWTDDDELMDFCGWALDTFCAHTAVASSVLYEDIAASTLVLPDNVYGDVESSGYVYLNVTDVGWSQVKPARLFDFAPSEEITYSVWGSTLQFSEAVSGDVLVRYFALYPHPTDDNSEITIPAWAYTAVAHLIGAYALTMKGISSAGIDRYKGEEDRGSPEDNALRAQQVHLLKVYDLEIARHPRQIRENSYQRLVL
jgi:hypothetical protein